MSTTQMLKGILEGCILAIIDQEPAYGYELSVKLQKMGLEEVSEGSIYPILLRLQKGNFIIGTMRKSDAGPKRKYYHLTDEGKELLASFREDWQALKGPVDHILNQGGEVDGCETADSAEQ